MPEISQYQFTHKELLVALVKQAQLHEGKWQLMVTFGLGAANMGPTPETVVPGAAVAVQGVGLTRAVPESPPALVIDAAEVNPPLKGGVTLKKKTT
jgi:hypothetical protein